MKPLGPIVTINCNIVIDKYLLYRPGVPDSDTELLVVCQASSGGMFTL